MTKKWDWADCMDASLTPLTSRDALLASGGLNYWIVPSSCLRLRLTDPGNPWQPYADSFQRGGMYIEEEIRWYDLRYIITASGTAMSCSHPHFCPLTVGWHQSPSSPSVYLCCLSCAVSKWAGISSAALCLLAGLMMLERAPGACRRQPSCCISSSAQCTVCPPCRQCQHCC